MTRRAVNSMRGSRGSRRGSAMVELALSLGFLIPLFLGTWQYGYTFYLYNRLEQAVRAGARYGSLQPYHSANTTPTSAYLTAVQNVVVYGTDSPPDGATPIVPNLTTGQVGVSMTFTSGVPTGVSVFINGYQMPGYFGSLSLPNKPLAWFPYVGMFGPP